MRVGIIQSNYLPWRGYLDLVRQVDLFLFHDDIQYTKQDWRNRNRIKTETGWRWLTVPVRHHHSEQRINEIEISYDADWRREHLAQLDAWYARAPFHRRCRDDLAELLAARPRSLSELNRAVCAWLLDQLAIRTPLRSTSDLSPSGQKTDRLLDILGKVGATAYLSGPAAKVYIEADRFRDAGIGLEFKTYDYAPYPQQWGDFIDNMSAIDLLMNVGAEAARDHIRSNSPNEVVSAPAAAR